MAKLAIRAAVPGNAKESVRMVGQLNRHEGMAVGAITPGIVRIHGFGKGRSFYALVAERAVHGHWSLLW